MIIVDQNEKEQYRIFGYHNEDDFLAVLKVGAGKAYFNQRRLDEAIAMFDLAITDHYSSHISAEAIYWKGVCLYRKGKGDSKALHETWALLPKYHPTSEWTKKVSYVTF